jgi:hypothetical protein
MQALALNPKKNKKMKPFKSLLFVAAVTTLTSCAPSTEKQAPQTVIESKAELIKRGRYLTTIGGCNDCHSPKMMTPHGPEPDPTRLFSGHPQTEKLPQFDNNKEWMHFNHGLTAFNGPWGVSYAANLTPDDTGIGSWSFEQFKTAITKGKYKGLEGSRDLLPPMPWQMYRNFTEDDLLAVFTYLKSLPPVNNLVPTPIAPNELVASK